MLNKRMALLSSLIVVLVFVSSVSIAILPASSYRSGTSYSYGTSIDNYVQVDFAVYDTDNGGAEEFGYAAPGGDDAGQFIYAYQIYNVTTDFVVEFFNLTGVGEGAITSNAVINVILDSDDESEAGIEPDNWYSPTGAKVTWEFNDEQLLVAGEHSWFLVLSSDNVPVPGDFNFLGPDDGVSVPGDGNITTPEPCTIALFAVGSALVLKKRKRA